MLFSVFLLCALGVGRYIYTEAVAGCIMRVASWGKSSFVSEALPSVSRPRLIHHHHHPRRAPCTRVVCASVMVKGGKGQGGSSSPSHLECIAMRVFGTPQCSQTQTHTTTFSPMEKWHMDAKHHRTLASIVYLCVLIK